MALLVDSDPSTWTWQGIILANLVGLVVFSFWLGKQKGRMDELGRELHSLRQIVATIQAQSTPREVVSTTLGMVREQLDRLEKAFNEFRQSVFVKAIQVAHIPPSRE